MLSKLRSRVKKRIIPFFGSTNFGTASKCFILFYRFAVAEISSLISSTYPEILDTTISHKKARSKIYEILLLNAWRRRRIDVERLNSKLTITEKLVNIVIEHMLVENGALMCTFFVLSPAPEIKRATLHPRVSV